MPRRFGAEHQGDVLFCSCLRDSSNNPFVVIVGSKPGVVYRIDKNNIEPVRCEPFQRIRQPTLKELGIKPSQDSIRSDLPDNEVRFDLGYCGFHAFECILSQFSENRAVLDMNLKM